MLEIPLDLDWNFSLYSILLMMLFWRGLWELLKAHIYDSIMLELLCRKFIFVFSTKFIKFNRVNLSPIFPTIIFVLIFFSHNFPFSGRQNRKFYPTKYSIYTQILNKHFILFYFNIILNLFERIIWKKEGKIYLNNEIHKIKHRKFFISEKFK